VVHRDLKPENILLNRRGEPVITDFGLAFRMEELVEEARISLDGMLIGSPAYMSPEQVNGQVALFGPTCDIYSLGVILFELLTGVCPYEGNLTSILAQIARDPVPLPSSRCSGISPALDAICQRAMAKEPSERFKSMTDFANCMDEFLAGRFQAEPVAEIARQRLDDPTSLRQQRQTAVPPSQPRFRDFARSHRTLIFLLAISAVLVAAFAYSMTPPAPGRLILTINPSEEDLQFYLDEVWRPRDDFSEPITLSAGKHLLDIMGPDRLTYRRRVYIDLKPGQTFDFEYPPQVTPSPSPEK